MAAFVLIHGAGDVGWYWHLVAAELRERGHDTVAPDLPFEDDSGGLAEYADAVAAAAGDRTGLVVVAQSLGGFTAPLVPRHHPRRDRRRAHRGAEPPARAGGPPRRIRRPAGTDSRRSPAPWPTYKLAAGCCP